MDKITNREAFRLNKRAFVIWWKKAPGIFLSLTADTVLGALIPYVGIYLSARIINELTGSRNEVELIRLVLITLMSAAVLAIGKAVLNRWKNSESSAFYYQRKNICSEKLLNMDFNYVDSTHTHDLYYMINQNENWIGWGLGRIREDFNGLLSASVKIIGAAALTVSLFTLRIPDGTSGLDVLNKPVFAVMLIFIMIMVTILAPMISNKAETYWTRNSEEARKGNRLGYYGRIGNDRKRALDIRIYRQDVLCRQYSKDSNIYGAGGYFSKYAKGPMGTLKAAAAAVSQLFTGIVYIFVCLKAWGGAFGVGSVTQYIAAITALSAGIAEFVHYIGDMHNNTPFLRTVFEFLDIPNDMYQGSLTVEKRSDRNYEIEFRDVSFRYPGSDTWALHHASMKFKIGKRLAVVGENGSGKTTFIKLLCRLYDPEEGTILLNGIDIRKYDYREYLSIFSVVFQDFQLLSFPLGQNVAASEDYDREKAKQCLEDAGFGERLKQMGAGLDTCLNRDFDEKGVEVSGGEAQKIAIARALYKDAPFIVLDEPTAALDPIAEYEIYTKFDQIVEDKTAVYISHRLSSCLFCDEVAVFDGGKIVQHGTHEELLCETDGKYYELWTAQAQYYAITGIRNP